MAGEDLGDLLGIWAHPDDETYLSSGLMALAVRNGRRVRCLTATRGELGSWDEERWPLESMGEVREKELAASLRVLGVTDHRFLGFPDGGCSSVPLEEAVAPLAEAIREFRPHAVLTFGPEGMTGHPDHRAVSGWATVAFRRAAPPGARLLYATKTPEYAERLVPVINRFNVFGPGTPPVTPPEELAVDFTLPEDLLELKLRALEAHRSQVEAMLGVFGPELAREEASREWFRLAERKD